MVKRATVHDTFVINRTFAFNRELVFASWASAEAKSQWFVGPTGWTMKVRELEFRVGGPEGLTTGTAAGEICYMPVCQAQAADGGWTQPPNCTISQQACRGTSR